MFLQKAHANLLSQTFNRQIFDRVATFQPWFSIQDTTKAFCVMVDEQEVRWVGEYFNHTNKRSVGYLFFMSPKQKVYKYIKEPKHKHQLLFFCPPNMESTLLFDLSMTATLPNSQSNLCWLAKAHGGCGSTRNIQKTIYIGNQYKHGAI